MEPPRWHKQVTAAVRKIGRDLSAQERKDLCQEAYLALLKLDAKIEEVLDQDGVEAAERYVYTVAKNAALQSVRSERSRKQVSLSDPAVFAEAENQSNHKPALDTSELQSALSILMYNEKYIMQKLYGLGCEQLTESQLGEQLSRSRDSIHRQKVSILTKMRKHLSK